MRAYNFSPAFAAALAARRNRTIAVQEVCVPLYLPAPDYSQLLANAESEDQAVDASGITIGAEEDDDFY